ncbi:hypothetical protein C3Y87_10020 [Carbonactinospora thermoautotrophica]|uniref:hypothetical protein n=1 Tax=Carbonactinospora thermoautotrophica TaxID=1469144 RepID=UPI00227151A3|nr:hypothetical protein [Carbonactinospora thermoautotrophica]MCX9191745.1 hypothetical protein [Carbonactinospora thermoautotrophica]
MYDSEGVLDDYGLERDDVILIGAGPNSSNLFLIVKNGHPEAGKVLWIDDGESVDRFDDFAEFFASIMEYHKGYVENLQQKSKT